jgi:hypothetical protein
VSHLRVIAVDVNDRRLNHFGKVAAVARRSTPLAWRGETNLIVDDQVNGSTDFKVRYGRHVQSLLVNSLSCKSGIAVHLEFFTLDH